MKDHYDVMWTKEGENAEKIMKTQIEKVDQRQEQISLKNYQNEKRLAA